jgi:uncharacterized Ntn-hydrolase superfamily protein
MAQFRESGTRGMTWSIVARDRDTGDLGVAVATRFFAAGALVPYAAPNAGAIATQALVNPFYGIDGLIRLGKEEGPDRVLGDMLAADEGICYRQVHAVDARGRTFAHTGSDCLPYCGHIVGEHFSVAGNMLACQDVLQRTADIFHQGTHLPFPLRLVLAMKAGEEAGGDRRGRQSAALLIAGRDDWPSLSIRVDDHSEPLQELERLERISKDEWVAFRRMMPTRERPSGITDPLMIQTTLRHGYQSADV